MYSTILPLPRHSKRRSCSIWVDNIIHITSKIGSIGENRIHLNLFNNTSVFLKNHSKLLPLSTTLQSSINQMMSLFQLLLKHFVSLYSSFCFEIKYKYWCCCVLPAIIRMLLVSTSSPSHVKDTSPLSSLKPLLDYSINKNHHKESVEHKWLLSKTKDISVSTLCCTE